MDKRVPRILRVGVAILESSPPRFVVRATAEVNSGGWTQPRLVASGDVVDGVLTFDFVAHAPAPGTVAPAVMTSLTASQNLGFASGVKTVRVRSETNSIDKELEQAWVVEVAADGIGDAFPWASAMGGPDLFPWSVKSLRDLPISLRDIVGRRFRLVRPGDSVTQEIQPGRVTVHVNEEGRVVDVVVEPGNDV